MISNYKKIKEYNKEANSKDQLYSKIFSHPISIFIVSLVEDTFITPNVLTLISLCFSLLGAYFIGFQHSYIGLLIGAICIHFALVFDGADGQLARWKGLKSDFGAYLDVITDQIQHRLIIAAIAIRYFDNYFVLALAFLALAILSIVGHENILQKNIKLRNPKIQEKRDSVVKGTKKRGVKSLISWFIANFSSYYIYLMIFCIINKPLWFLYFLVIYYSFWFVKRFLVFFLIRNK